MPELVPPVVPAGRLRDQPQPTLTVGDLVLRPWQVADAGAVVAAYQDPDIQRWHVRTVTDDEAAQWPAGWAARWADETAANWAITSHEILVGRIGLRSIDLAGGEAEAAYWVLPSARGRNVAARALDAMTRWTFTRVGLHRIELAHAVANPASCRVAVKAGYLIEGTKRRQGRHADGWHDMHLHARLADDEPAEPAGR